MISRTLSAWRSRFFTGEVSGDEDTLLIYLGYPGPSSLRLSIFETFDQKLQDFNLSSPITTLCIAPERMLSKADVCPPGSLVTAHQLLPYHYGSGMLVIGSMTGAVGLRYFRFFKARKMQGFLLVSW